MRDAATESRRPSTVAPTSKAAPRFPAAAAVSCDDIFQSALDSAHLPRLGTGVPRPRAIRLARLIGFVRKSLRGPPCSRENSNGTASYRQLASEPSRHLAFSTPS